MKIHELAIKTGLTAPTIRYYEKEGLIDSRHVRRGKNNYRDYAEETIEHLMIIKRLQSVGFSLGEMTELFQEYAVNKLTISKGFELIELFREKIREIEQKQIEFAQIHKTLNEMLKAKISLMNELEDGNSF
ncbi:MerR family transcriptional regulator [Cohnella zeiphila]|uniref:MerR family transcriptional regulator n=1 Tax=Cohnella zeiphila TaxID=2761120 RepID=A0A7X0VXX4_9BACL|nr:MerR family transcriptional regulator [Cohnella zeiphila]MBB6734769.1 MerR family transcriptional regulator [Cohnella zeiphila]